MSTDEIPTKGLFGVLMGVAAVALFLHANTPTLDGDSVQYAAVAKEIVRSGRWLLPFDPVYNAPYYFHFPLSVWVPAVMFKLFGVSVFTARLYSLLMAMVAVAGIFSIGRVLANSWVGWCAGLSFLLTDHVLRIARQCRVDLPLIAFLVLAFLALILAQSAEAPGSASSSRSQSRSKRWYLLFGLAVCGAVLTKEVVGLVPLGVAAAYLGSFRRWSDLIHPMFLVGWIIALGPVVGLTLLEKARYQTTTWAMYHGQMFLWFLKEAEHLTKPWYYYLWAIWDKYWYFLPLALIGTWGAIQKIRNREEPRWGIVLLWAVALPLGFSLAKHKVHYYILPMYAATALLIGLACDRLIRGVLRQRLVTAVVVLGIIGGITASFFPANLHKQRFAENVRLVTKLDPILAKEPGELIVVRQDVASLLFYSRVITRVTSAHEWPYFRDLLGAPAQKRRYGLIGKKDWELLEPEIRSRWQTVIDDGNRLVVREG